MNPTSLTPNPILENSLLGSKWFNPEYLFKQGIVFFDSLFAYLGSASGQIASFYRMILLIFSLFFLAVIFYTTIRIFEIRSKEKKHLEHEIS